MKTRILMFGWEFPPHNSGGLGVACYGLTRALSEIGTEVIFVMPKKLDVGASWLRMVFADMPKVKVRAIDSAVTPYPTGGRYLRYEELKNGPIVYGSDLMGEVMRYAAAGRAIAAEEQFDIIYAHDWLSFGAAMEAKRLTGKPMIAHVHATEYDRSGGSNVNGDVYEIEKAGMQMADVVVAVSEYTRQIIIKYYGIPADKVRVVYNGIDDSTMPKGRGTLPRMRAMKSAGYKLVLFLGRITLQKGPDYFVRVAQKVAERNPKVIFILSGSGDMQEKMIDMAARLGVADRMLFTGFVAGAERHEIYSVADLFVMPSISEPFGITPLEAMKLGTPVLISKQSGVSEVVQHALKVDFWDIDEMTNKILALVGYPGLSETLSQQAQREAERLTWLETAKNVNNIVNELVK